MLVTSVFVLSKMALIGPVTSARFDSSFDLVAPC